MDIWDASKLAVFIGFVVPGFISLKTYQLICPYVHKNSADQIIDAVAYSSINYALLLWPIYEVERHGIRISHPTLYVLFYVLVLLVAPIVWAVLLQLLRKTELFQRILPHPTQKPWDYVFSKRNKRYWIIVTLKDGKRIAGRYDGGSFSSSAPAGEQLYLEEAWDMNEEGGFERPRTDSAGILILSADMLTVEFFNMTTGDRNDEEAVKRGLSTEGTEGIPASSTEASA